MEPSIHAHESLVYLTFLRFESTETVSRQIKLIKMELTLKNFSESSQNLLKELKKVDGAKGIWYLRDETYQEFEVDLFVLVEYAEATEMQKVHEILHKQRGTYPRGQVYLRKEWFTIPMKAKYFEDRKKGSESIGASVQNMQLLDYSGLEQQAIKKVEEKLEEFFESRKQPGFTFNRFEAEWNKSEGKKVVIFGPTHEEADRDEEKNTWEFDWPEWLSDMGWEMDKHKYRHVAGHFYLRPLPT
ncbi:hypothetical protein EMPG_11397 [Blastomyces silverae]|uniref:Uncharacterized protein n=1 Tax=Blastomyces silverae TaxID=2060906 RepID=A0A0H1BQ55_9EURO|nr:hypothetical protein EMPG_11397 [Blastomyces silverae]